MAKKKKKATEAVQTQSTHYNTKDLLESSPFGLSWFVRDRLNNGFLMMGRNWPPRLIERDVPDFTNREDRGETDLFIFMSYIAFKLLCFWISVLFHPKTHKTH